jgi:ubiquinone/menaquinone biosynthesis C-methylase UbiE
MPTDYDAIAEQYRQAKQQPWRACIEAFTLTGLLGDLTGRTVVDLACGEGHYTRLLPGLGAARVVGVDRSEGMIALARAQEVEHPLGIAYLVQDCRSLQLPGRFDVATAAYLLNYATGREELGRMCSAIASGLEPGGRFVTMNSRPGVDISRSSLYRKYGFEVRPCGEHGEGMRYLWIFHLAGGPVEVENYDLPASAYEEALRSAGFREVRWHDPALSPVGAAAFAEGFWDDFLDHPPIVGIECRL